MYVDFAGDRLNSRWDNCWGAEGQGVHRHTSVQPLHILRRQCGRRKGGPDKGMRERHPFLRGAPCAIVPDNLSRRSRAATATNL